jgi:septal ring factor EnvC (AmiA/AmiB activator)
MTQEGIPQPDRDKTSRCPTCGIARAAEIPRWLRKQTKRDIETVESALRRVGSNLRDTNADRDDIEVDFRTARRAIQRLEQDVRYVKDFIGGAVRRREGRAQCLGTSSRS